MKSLDPLIHEAIIKIRVDEKAAADPTLILEQKVKLLLIKQLVGESNRMFAGSRKWKEMMKEFLTGMIRNLNEYYRRENSESGFAADKKLFA